jgi:hypothetical protein
MNNLERYLKKFKTIIGDKAEEKRIIQGVLKSETNLDVLLDQIRIDKGVVVFDLSPIERGEVIMRKKAILEAFVKKGLRVIDLR